MNKTLLVIGAGPKALAIHTKACVLRELGRDAPDVVIIEKEHTGANWSGATGYTDGKRNIVTAPEKDIGFPYRSKFGLKVDLLMSKYSWHTYKIYKREIADWIDKERPSISHSDFGQYLEWVGNESNADIRIGQVLGNIVCDDNEWIVPYYPHGQEHPVSIRASALVITGPGSPCTLSYQKPHPNISNSETFWIPSILDEFKNLQDGDFAVIEIGRAHV